MDLNIVYRVNIEKILKSPKLSKQGHRKALHHLYIYIYIYIHTHYQNTEPKSQNSKALKKLIVQPNLVLESP